MRFGTENKTRVLPFGRPDILKTTLEQLRDGTIVTLPLLSVFGNHDGIQVNVRSSLCYTTQEAQYLLTNDERRRVIRILASYEAGLR